MKCPECQSELVRDNKSGELYCKSCGLVVESQPIDLRFEHNILRYKSRGIDIRRFGQPLTYRLHNYGLSTGFKYSSKMAEQFRRKYSVLKKYNADKKGTLFKLLSEINNIAKLLDLPNFVQDTACMLAHKFCNNKPKWRFKIQILARALIILATNLHAYPLPPTNVAKDKELKFVNRYCKRLKKHLNIQIDRESLVYEFIKSICNSLGLNASIIKKAFELYDFIKDKYNVSYTPNIIAASVVRIITAELNHPIKMKDIAKLAGVTEVAMRYHIKAIKELIENEKELSRRCIEEIARSNYTY